MAHVRKTVLGLAGLYIADIPSSKLLKDAEWEQLALNLEGTFSLTQEDTEETKINVEENDNPIVQILKAGARSFTTSIPDLAFEVAQKLMGASKATVNVEGENVTRVYLPDDAAYIYKMFKIVPKQGVEQFYYAKGQISAKINGNLSKTETLNVDLKVTALTPDTTSETAFSYDLIEGTNPGYLLGNTVASGALANIIAVSDGSLSLTVDGGTAEVNNAIDFTADTTWAEVTATLNAAFTGSAKDSVWSFDEEEFRMKVTSAKLGAGSTIALTDGSGTAIRGATMLNMSASTPVEGS